MMLTASFAGLDAFTLRLERLINQSDVEELLDEVTASMLARTRARYLQQVDPDGMPWIPSFAAIRRALHGKGGGTLFDTGDLFHSIQAAIVDKNTRAIGTDVPYAVKHQEGQDGMVQRVFLGFGDEDVEVAQKIMIERFNHMLQGDV